MSLTPSYLHLDFWSPDPLVPNSILVNTYSSIVSLSSYMQLAHLPRHHLTFLALYINCSYLTCSSLVHISNKILPSCPSTHLWTPHSPTHARDTGLHPRPVYSLIGYHLHNRHHLSDRVAKVQFSSVRRPFLLNQNQNLLPPGWTEPEPVMYITCWCKKCIYVLTWS